MEKAATGDPGRYIPLNPHCLRAAQVACFSRGLGFCSIAPSRSEAFPLGNQPPRARPRKKLASLFYPDQSDPGSVVG